jgi:mono/diheme cytochrome c family protein
MIAMMRLAVRFALLTLAALGVVLGWSLWNQRRDGFSTREEPRTLERIMARTARRWAVPAAARATPNPIPYSPAVWTEARAHFADHCASCHANDGSGDTELGRNLYPRAPDMRLAATQDLTDGEIYWVIANGVRLTGMPAWGPGGPNDADTWKLVHFIRRLKELAPDDLRTMKALNPKSPDELEEERQDEQFLSGDSTPPEPAPAPHHHIQ